ncbi:MAG: sulfatase-like hydrolase/transferase, partial [Planctomycetaceae bacterium]|nr:sulfatase-like hydrolase/transferase [Planctomycetaceae bacterium]
MNPKVSFAVRAPRSWLIFVLAIVPAWTASSAAPPNLIVILADDIGYGDLGRYGATQVATPHLDRLARQGLRFTDAHSPAAVCTPSRYGLLTGRYPWRHPPASRILSGVAPLCIEADRVTLASFLQQAGYRTGVVGKWHLGLGRGPTDYNRIDRGPTHVGFARSFIIPATGDRTPCVYVANERVVGYDPADPIQVSYDKPIGHEPTGKEHPELLKVKPSHGHDNTIVAGISRIGYMTGGRQARWNDETMADDVTAQAVAFIEDTQQQPFFLYLATHDIHVPRVPHRRFAGSSQCGTRGDVIQQLDGCVGEILAALDRLHLADD